MTTNEKNNDHHVYLQDLEREIMKIVRFHNLTHLSTEFIREVVHKTTLSQMKTEKPVEEWFTHWHKESFTIYRKGKQISPMQLLQSLLSAI